MTDFLLELFCEEIPARMQDKAREDLTRLVSEQLAAAGLKGGAVISYATPRRLALIVRDLPLQTEPTREERKGPRADAPPAALEGFLRSTGLTRDQLEEREDKKGGKTLFAIVEKPGRATADVLAEAIPAVIRAFPWPKSMRWSAASRTTESLRWVRPLQGIVALFGDEVVPVSVDGIVAGVQTVGHRFHHEGPVTIGSATEYADTLRAAHVLVDQDERRALIRNRAKALAADKGLVWIEDEALVRENAGLTEWPVPLIGDFDPAFLEVPPEVIRLTLATNQKYFVCADADGKLAPAFICTANIDASDGGTAIVDGNRKVLAARLSDARFFWEQDQRTPLADHARKLTRITFHEKLGSVADKVDRVAKLARWLVEQGVVGDDEADRARLADMAEQAARLAKADLVTEMVGEFPELQGLMGGYYAAHEGLDPLIASAIRDHYKPVGPGDDVPSDPVTVAVSLADKLDTVRGFFLIGEPPTGSKDPFALRRAALGIIRLITENGLRGSLNDWLARATTSHLETCLAAMGRPQSAETLYMQVDGECRRLMRDGAEVLRFPVAADAAAYAGLTADGLHPGPVGAFFADRLKVQQKEAGVRHDLIDAVFALGGEGDLVRLLARVRALQAFIVTEDGANLLAGYKRAANLLKQAGGSDADMDAAADVAPDTLAPADRALRAALDIAEPKAAAAVEAEDFAEAMAVLAALRGPVDAFFDSVMVNDPDPATRAFRLGLLARLRNAVHQVADFSKIVD